MKKIGVGFAEAEDGQKLYFSVAGEGFPMAACNGIGVSTFFWKHISRCFVDRCRILTG